ncbi:ABC transporter permease [Streptomyces sp. JNUCC 63]
MVEAVPRLGLVSPDYLPPTSTIAAALAEEMSDAAFWVALGDTLTGWAVGLLIATAAGVAAGVLITVVPYLREATASTVEGVRAIDGVLADTARSYGIEGRARLGHLVLRSASPQIFAGLRQALSIGVIPMVISEMFAASNGLGFAVVQFQRSFAIPGMWSGILLLGLLGVLLALVFQVVERRALAWYHGLRQSRKAS